MPRDQCIDCEIHVPGGEGLEDGRCPACAADYAERQRVKPPEGEPQGDGEEEGQT
jgi:hypothetical protein